MKEKLQALIKEQKALTAKFEEMLKELHSTIEEFTTLDPKKVYIKGHPTRGAEAIKMLEDLGGINKFNWDGTSSYIIYRIRHEDNVILSTAIEDLRYTPCNIELHLPEDVSEVDPPKEEVEQLKFITASDTIVGEIYTLLANNYRYIFIHNGFGLNCFKPLCIMRFDEQMEFLSIGGSLSGNFPIIESSKAEKDYILKALELNGKHFDKKNMRLLDVEEWSCEKGLPIIVRNDTNNWIVNIFHSYDAVDTKYPFLCAICDEEGHPYKYAIPYNNHTKHLIGTTDSPDKHYKFVENGEL